MNPSAEKSPAHFSLPGSAAVAESHSAVVMFVGDRAYKVKKPVDFGFLDFSTVEARERACRHESELNRRLAPDVYLDLCRVVDGQGFTCDWIVVMRRMPESRRLATLVAQGADVRGDLEQLARRLASFHSAAKRGADIDVAGNPAELRKRWLDNFAGIEPYVGAVLDRGQTEEIVDLALRFLDGRSRLLEDRIERGCIVDGHGDLLAEDIFCLDDGPRVLDCLEFDDELRYVDGLDDVAFLAMDLERLGAAEQAGEFLTWYQEFSDAPSIPSLAHHYIAYRALVRSKVACLRADQGAKDAVARARQLMTIAVEHLRAGQVRMVLVGGLPGTGKSTIAGALADRMGAVLLRTDQIRKEIPGMPEVPRDNAYGQGRYKPGHVHETYQAMLARANTLLERGESVVLDASWSDETERARARSVAHESSSRITELRCDAPFDVTESRIAARTGDLSDATADIAASMARQFAAWPESISIDTSTHADNAIAAAWAACQVERDEGPQ